MCSISSSNTMDFVVLCVPQRTVKYPANYFSFIFFTFAEFVLNSMTAETPTSHRDCELCCEVSLQQHSQLDLLGLEWSSSSEQLLTQTVGGVEEKHPRKR